MTSTHGEDGQHEHQEQDLADVILLQSFWDERYSSAEQVWSGAPNAQLVAEASDVPPGRALDVGCGEGADSLWLAGRGWRVTGADLSPVALARAAAAGHRAGADVAGRLMWQHADLVADPPPPASFDLVSVHFLQLPPEPRSRALAGLSAAVAPGGTLLWVGHDPSDLHHGIGAHRPEGLMPTAADVAAGLDEDLWSLDVVEVRPRAWTDPDGHPRTVHDAVLRARRR